MPATNLVRTGVCLAILPVVFCACAVAAEPQTILLWPDGAPGSERKNSASKIPEEVVRVNENGEHIVSGIHHPSITAYLPAEDKSTGAAVVIAPGGGHRELWMDHEGYNVANRAVTSMFLLAIGAWSTTPTFLPMAVGCCLWS